MIQDLWEPIMQLIGNAIIGSFFILLVLLNKRISAWFLTSIWAKLSDGYRHRLKRSLIVNDMKIREILIELRTLVSADRACLFQFHNGNTFTTKNPIWKVSNTHESVSPGTSSEIGKLQDIKASSLIETLRCFWVDDYPFGVYKIAPEYCGECSSKLKPCDKKILFIDVYELEDCYSKSLLIEQGITYVIDVPIFNGDQNCIGFISVCYCDEHDVETLKRNTDKICRNASQIQFILSQGN